MWPWGSLDTPPRGLSHATPLGGCCVTVHDPSPAHAGGSCLPCQGGSPTKSTRAHTLFRDLNRGTAGNAFVTQMRLLPHALVPEADDRSDAITVVRRPSEAGYMRTYEQRRAQLTGSSYTAPAWEFVVMTPPYLGMPLDNPPHTTITASRNCGNKEGASKYPVATLTIQNRRTQRVDLPRGPRRRKGAQRLGLEIEDNI